MGYHQNWGMLEPCAWDGHAWPLTNMDYYAIFDHCWSSSTSIRVDISWKIWDFCIPPFKVIKTDKDWSGTYDILLTIHGNHGSILYCFQDIARFWPNIANFSESMFIWHNRGSSP